MEASMTLLILSGNKDEIRKIFESIKPELPEILEVSLYNDDQKMYVTLMEPLQKDARLNLQDWNIIEYCQTWRSTPEIKKYFGLEYEAVREICDRLYCSGALSRRVRDKAYEYLDRGLLHKCSTCSHFEKIDPENFNKLQRIELEDERIIGKCLVAHPEWQPNICLGPYRNDEPIECKDFEQMQRRI